MTTSVHVYIYMHIHTHRHTNTYIYTHIHTCHLNIEWLYIYYVKTPEITGIHSWTKSANDGLYVAPLKAAQLLLSLLKSLRRSRWITHSPSARQPVGRTGFSAPVVRGGRRGLRRPCSLRAAAGSPLRGRSPRLKR